MNASYVATPLRDALRNPRTASPDSSSTPRSHRAMLRLFELVRVSLERLLALGLRGPRCVRPTSALRNS